MVRLKMLIVAAAAVSIAALALGTASAFGAAGDPVLCKSASSPCASGSQYPAATTLTMGLQSGGGGAVFRNNIDPVTCTSSTMAVRSSAQAGSPLPAQVTALTFSNCTDPMGSACTPEVEGLPYSASVLASASAGNGALRLNTLALKFACGAIINCTFSAPTGGFSGQVFGGNPAQVTFSGVALSHSSGIECPDQETFSARYLTNGHNQPVWIEAST